MSSTVGFHLSFADEEAEHRRELRGDVAFALARLAVLRARAGGLGHVVPGDLGVLELQELLSQVTAALASAEESVNAAWREQRGFEAVPSGLSGHALRGAVADARWLITGKGHLCEEEAVGAALVVFEDLSRSDSVADARALSLEIAVIIGRSLARYRDVMAGEDLRVRLLDAVRCEDTARHRRTVASAVAEALAGLGCAVGADFARWLVVDGYAAATIGEHWLWVRLHFDGTALFVEEAPAEIVEKLPAELRERGVRLDDTPFVLDDNWELVIQ
ncbi:hypothetical protein ACSHWB_42315 [Lentzea sp. HUAS TT2]|uniref:hypothetical protein n=1 Tax=Lentzea sp. HUAS TT2 TaxID=3447454 RepID=UPI003F716DF0